MKSYFVRELNRYLVKNDSIVKMKFNKKYLKQWLIESTESEKPENLFIQFPLLYLENSKIAFDTPDASVDSVNYTCLVYVDSDSYGKFCGIRLTIHSNGDIYIHFREDWSGICYELQLDNILFSSVPAQEISYEILIQGTVERTATVPMLVVNKGEKAITDWIRCSNLYRKFEKNDLECLVELSHNED